jgi:hypothetical protein
MTTCLRLSSVFRVFEGLGFSDSFDRIAIQLTHHALDRSLDFALKGGKRGARLLAASSKSAYS